MKYLKFLSIYCLTGTLLLFSSSVFSQIKKEKETIRVVAEKDTIIETGTYSALVYFSGEGQHNARVMSIFSADLTTLMKTVDSASNGAIVNFDYLRFTNSKGVTTDVKDNPYNFNKSQSVNQFKSQSVQEVEKLQALKFISGIVYFSGAGFTNVLSVKATDTSTLNKYYALSRPGTTIALDNCIYKNTNGSLSSPISKLIKLE